MLAAKLTADDLSALDGIWELCGNDLFGLAHWRTASMADTEDVVQEVFVRLARYPQALRQARRPSYGDWPEEMRTAVRSVLEHHGSALEILHRAAPLEMSSFAIQYDRGLNAEIPDVLSQTPSPAG